MMNKKNILKLSFILLIIFAPQKICYAATTEFSGVDEGPSNEWETIEGYFDEGIHRYKFSFKSSISSRKSFSINAYNMDGESVIPEGIDINSNKYRFKAGTWIGLNAIETQSINWRVDTENTECKRILKVYECTYKKKITECIKYETTAGIYDERHLLPNSPETNKCKETVTYYSKKEEEQVVEYNKDKCSQTNSFGYDLIESKDLGKVVEYDEQPEKCKSSKEYEMKIEEVKKNARNSIGRPSGAVKYIVNNSFPKSENDLEYKTIKAYNVNGVQVGQTDGTTYGSFHADYVYMQEKVCMDIKTAKVTYGRDCNKNEIKIKNETIYDKYLKKDVTYWHYFIPLNTKSNSDFSLQIIESENGGLNVKECTSLMEKRKNYQNYITPLKSNKSFIGDYDKYPDKTLSKDYQSLTRSNGCSLSIVVKFPITQRYYNETTDNKLKGFNIYYRPIDITNPFPNKLNNSSLWYEWNQSNEKEPDIKESYNEVTYVTQIKNPNTIRDYTKTNPYTSWDNMNLNGISEFIESQGIIKRLVNKNSFYKLGCGPSNKDWSECK